jgi:RNA polymerase sigma-70 factor, ECF subfamily
MILDQIQDRWLVEQFLLFRSDRVFGKLYDRHTTALYRLAMQWVDGCRPDAEELVQNTWLAAMKGLAQFRWECSLRTWLCSILINQSKKQLKKTKSFYSIETFNPSDQTVDPRRDSIQPFEWERALAKLPPGYQTVFILHDMEGYKHHEIGALMNIHEGTSKSQLFQARKLLRQILSN